MNLQEKLTLIEEVLDVAEGSLTPETLLAEVDEWDSIAALSLVVMLDEKMCIRDRCYLVKKYRKEVLENGISRCV